MKDKNAKIMGENPDFGRGLYVCEKPGHEFVGAGKAGTAIGLIGTQVFAMMFLVPVLGFFVLRNVIGVSAWVAGILAGVVSIVVVGLGICFLFKINRVNRQQGGYLAGESDSRFRVRAVIPNKKQDDGIMKWAELVNGGWQGENESLNRDDLKMIEGGFEPMIVTPWFGIKRDRRYWWTFGLMSCVVGVGFAVLLSILFGGWKQVLQPMGFLGYPAMGLILVGGIVSAELMWPVYVRLVPGQLDIFRYGFLGSGKPAVESFDLRKAGVCVDFGGYLIAIEPERAVGESIPEIVQAKRWPHGKAFPEGYMPMYFAVSMLRSRREFAQRLVQAARTDEPTPPVSMERLGE